MPVVGPCEVPLSEAGIPEASVCIPDVEEYLHLVFVETH